MTLELTDYPPIGAHGLIGDRRTAALVAADGTVDWFCAPDFDDDMVCGALLDARSGGDFRFGPEASAFGKQHYADSSACLVTRWQDEAGALELSDFMPWPERERGAGLEATRCIVRRMRALQGRAQVRLKLRPRGNFAEAARVQRCHGGAQLTLGARVLKFWASFAFDCHDEALSSSVTLDEGDEAWVVFGLQFEPAACTSELCRQWHDETTTYWRDWVAQLRSDFSCGAALQRCAITVHLLTHAPSDAVVAAITTSLPERVGGDRNYDYRYTWVRDASLSAALLASMGAASGVAHYFDWLCQRGSEVDAPLQVCYRTDGQTRLEERELAGVDGYCGSRPVQVGNRAYAQKQIGSLGWFADSALIFLQAGGTWKPSYWHLLQRCADHVCTVWQEADSGVWELTEEAHYVASKVMAWVTIDRALQVAQHLGEVASADWTQTCSQIHAEVMERGWSESRRSFRQRYDADALDAATLLIPLMGFLPARHPRVLASLDAIERELVIDGLVHRFDPGATLGGAQLPIGEFEGAFLPATFWYAQALAHAGHTAEAEAIVRRCEAITAGPGLYAEEADARSHSFLGNMPLLFSQVEYARTLLALQHLSSAKESS